MKTKSLFLTLVLLALGGSLSAQVQPAAPSSTGSITTNAANCNTTNVCVVLHMATSNVGYSVTASGTWTGTLTVEQSGDNQGSWTSATTTTANTLYTSALTPGITDVRVRGSAAMTGTAVVTITASGPATLQQVTGGSSSSSPVVSQFFISNVACGGATNCLQMNDDDTTDNCGAALTAWLAVVNAYAGPGAPQVTIYGSGAGKAYKLATANCELSFTSTKGAMVHLLATIDCAQTGTDCMRFGPTGQVSAVIGEDYSLDGTGVLYGGASLTSSCSPACAGILIEPGVNNFFIDGTQFRGPAGGTTNSGFGANNATLGNCTNYLIYVANPVSGGFIQHTKGGVTSSTSTVGGCGYANPLGFAAGTNTILFLHNTVGTIGFTGGSGACGSVGILDGGAYGVSADNNIYGFGMPIRVQGTGHRLNVNQIDSAQCVAATGSVSAGVHAGANGSGTAVTGLLLDGNVIQGGSSHTLNLLSIAGDSTATLNGATLVHNQTAGAGTANLFNTNTACTPTLIPCYIAGNINMTVQFPAGTIANGWGNSVMLACTNSQAALGANLAFTNMCNVPTSRTYKAYCEMIETTADAVSSTLPSCQFKYTDLVSGALVTRTVSAVNTGNTVGTISDGQIIIVVAGGGQLQYGTTGYLSNTGGVMKYTVGAFIETY